MAIHFSETNTKEKNVYIPDEIIDKLLEIQKRRKEDEENTEE